MALLTIPTTPEKGTSQSYTLNVTDLIALVSDAYFQDQANWSKVVVLYQSAESNQLELINFIPDGVSTSILSVAQFSTFARNVFDVNSITIFDNQNGRYIIKAIDIPDVANYAIDFSPSPYIQFTYETCTGSNLNPAVNPTSFDLAVGQYAIDGTSVASSVSGVATYDIAFELNNLGLYGGGSGIMVGLSNSPTSVSGYPNNGIYICIYDTFFQAVDGGGNMGSFGSGVGTGGSVKVRMKQSGSNTLSVYINDVLVFSANAGTSYANMYPFVYARDRSGNLTTSYNVQASAPIAWVNPATDVYNIEPDGGLTNGVNRGGSAYYAIFSGPSQVVTGGGDIDLTFNVGLFTIDTSFGFNAASGPSQFCGIVSGSGEARPHINDVWVASSGIDPSNKTFRITRISGVVTMYIDGVQIYTTSVATASDIRPQASLNAYTGTLLSSAKA
jgi:hypothetical protein